MLTWITFRIATWLPNNVRHLTIWKMGFMPYEFLILIPFQCFSFFSSIVNTHQLICHVLIPSGFLLCLTYSIFCWLDIHVCQLSVNRCLTCRYLLLSDTLFSVSHLRLWNISKSHVDRIFERWHETSYCVSVKVNVKLAGW